MLEVTEEDADAAPSSDLGIGLGLGPVDRDQLKRLAVPEKIGVVVGDIARLIPGLTKPRVRDRHREVAVDGEQSGLAFVAHCRA